MKTFYVICVQQRTSTGHMGSVTALNELSINTYWIDEKIDIGDRNIPEFSNPDEAISWYDALRSRYTLERDKFNKAQHGIFSSTIDDDLDDEIYIVQKVKF